ncbi:MAG TPA: pitrilysin family protein [Blastocatellia bacterium]|nr:pitrilysin family protein [Blastocatellia bacterium]
MRLVLACMLAGIGPAAATSLEEYHRQTQRQASPFLLPIVKRDSLLNGLQLIVLEQPGTGSVSTRLRINSGALFDLAGKGGLADLTAGMLLRGGAGFDAKGLRDTVERSGFTVNLSVGWDTTDIVVSGPADSLDGIFDLLGRLVIAPAFDQKELEALKSARIAEIKQELVGDNEALQQKAVESVFGTNPCGRPARGTPESVAQILRQDLVYYHSRFYLANNAELVVTGDAVAEQVTRLGRARLGAWKKGEKVAPSFRPPAPRSARTVLIMDRPEAQLATAVIAQIGFARRADDYFAAAITIDLLRQACSAIAAATPGVTIEVEHEPRQIPGPLLVKLKSNAAEIPGLLESVQTAMVRLQSEAPPSDRVESAKSRLITAVADRLSASEGAAMVILDMETYGLGRDYLINLAERVSAVAPADVQRAAKRYLTPQSAALVIAGPASKLETALKLLGAVTVSK